ncbi:MAG: ABC transporter ATP-binding protein [Synechococcales cyanobacterium]
MATSWLALRAVARFILPFWRVTAAIAAAGLFFAVINLGRPYLLGLFANVLTQQGSRPMWLETLAGILAARFHLTPLLATMISISLVFFCINLIAPFEVLTVHFFKRLTAIQLTTQLHQQAYRKIISLPLHYFETHNSGLLVSRLERAVNKLQVLYVSLVQGGILVMSGLFMSSLLFLSINPLLSLVFVLSMGACVAIISRLFVDLQPYITLGEQMLDRIMSRLSEIVLNIRTVKAFVQEERERQRGHHWLERFWRFMGWKAFWRFHVAETWTWVLLNFSFSVIIGTCVYLVLTDQIDVGEMITAITVAQIIRAEVSSLREPIELLTTSSSAIQWLDEFLRLPLAEPASGDVGIPNAPEQGVVLELRDLSFRYQPQLPPVLHHLSLTVAPFTTLALVGPSGSGKSTLTRLLYRFMDPVSGAILWNGQDIREFDLRHYRSRLAIVPQEVEVFNGTVLHNLLYGHPHRDPTQAVAAAKLARAHEFIQDLPGDYEAIVGERGIRLSGGQRQRLGIARAILMQPQVLILDEATSNLDSESERLIQEALESLFGTCTVIVIAHRLSTVRAADQIVVLDRGRIVEQGSHSELLSHQSGLYRRLHDLQAQGMLSDERTQILTSPP